MVRNRSNQERDKETEVEFRLIPLSRSYRAYRLEPCSIRLRVKSLFSAADNLAPNSKCSSSGDLQQARHCLWRYISHASVAQFPFHVWNLFNHDAHCNQRKKAKRCENEKFLMKKTAHETQTADNSREIIKVFPPLVTFRGLSEQTDISLVNVSLFPRDGMTPKGFDGKIGTIGGSHSTRELQNESSFLLSN